MRSAAAVVLTLALAAPAGAQTLERVKATGELRIGFRDDSAPFSYANAIGEASGFTVELCRAVAVQLKDAVGLEDLSLDYVAVTTKERFDAVVEGRIDLLCGADTHTLERRERVDFSIPTFVDGTSVLYRTDGPASFEDLEGRRVGVLPGTTTEEALRASLEQGGIAAEVVIVPGHDVALEQLLANEISAYFSDRGILYFLAARASDSSDLRVSDRQFTIEPYGLALTKGDSAFRLEVDRALSRIYRSGEVEKIFQRTFGAYATLSDALKTLYVVSAIPE